MQQAVYRITLIVVLLGLTVLPAYWIGSRLPRWIKEGKRSFVSDLVSEAVLEFSCWILGGLWAVVVASVLIWLFPSVG